MSTSVALVVDQAPVGNLAFPILYDLAAVETLRGPQGTLFGQGASAGVINIRTVAPSTDRISVSGSMQYADKGTAGSEFGEQIYDAAINLPLSNQIALRVASQYRIETGLQRRMNAVPGKPAGTDNEISDFGIRGKLLIEPTTMFRINLSAEYGKREEDGQTFGGIAIRPNSTTPLGPPGSTVGDLAAAAYLNPATCGVTKFSLRAEQYCEEGASYIETEILAFSGRIDIDLNDDITLTSVSSYRDRKYSILRREFSRLVTAPAARNERYDENSDGFSQELRISWTPAKTGTLMLPLG